MSYLARVIFRLPLSFGFAQAILYENQFLIFFVMANIMNAGLMKYGLVSSWIY